MNTQLLKVIFASEKRKKTLLLLESGPKKMDFLLDTLDTNRAALLPQVRTLEKHYLVEDTRDIYNLTFIGKLVVSEMVPLLNLIEPFEKNLDYWASHYIDSIPLELLKRIKEISECEVINPNPSEMFELNHDFVESVNGSSNLYAAISFMHPSFAHVLESCVGKNTSSTIILNSPLLDKLKEEWSEQLKKFLSCQQISFHVYPGDLDILSLTISDQCFVLRLKAKNNTFSNKQVFCCDPEAVDWSKDLFRHYLLNSRPLIISDL